MRSTAYKISWVSLLLLLALAFSAGTMHAQTDLPPCFEQITPYNSLGSLVLWSREDVEVSAYILRQLLAGGNGVPNASRIAF